ncbi:DUF6221 family protein [Streptosporangium saharense]|uniref:DUF6221 family protein n=1 Tax=Streptosporangium saharense TaxID=1706840 RepID=UPI0033209402
MGFDRPLAATWPIHHAEVVLAPAAGHIILHDPARVLREVEAKRRIMGLHQEGVDNDLPDDEEPDPAAGDTRCMVCAAVGEPPYYPCQTLRILAHPYADHPDYQPEWAP